jgi:hypothetical protein
VENGTVLWKAVPFSTTTCNGSFKLLHASRIHLGDIIGLQFLYTFNNFFAN